MRRIKRTKKEREKMPAVMILSLGFLITILIGTFLLAMPFSSKSGEFTNFVDSLFTATSAVCVTGLVPFDTCTHWSRLGQVIIIILIQIGGLGFMTVITLLFMIFKKNIGILNQSILMQSAGSYSISSVIPLMKKILIGTVGFEGLGAIILFLCFRKQYGSDALFLGIFTSISAFCNAGFDCFGAVGGSVTDFSSNWPVLMTLMVLIIVGGLGFVVWSDIVDSRFKWKKYQMHTKIVLSWSAILIIVPAILFFIFEFTDVGHNGKFTDMSLSDKILNSLFLSVSPRTAGFNSVNLSELTPSGVLLTIMLMFIGGCPGSTAGGVKVTTIVVVLLNLFAAAGGKDNITIFNRRINNKVVKQSSALVLSYLIIIVASCMIISAIEPTYSLEQILFEVVSAIGTVGLTLGITGGLLPITKIILIILMYLGRLGAFTLFDLIIQNNGNNHYKDPEGRILVG